MAISRRTFLLISAALALGGTLSYPQLKRERRKSLFARHVKGAYDASPFDTEVITTISLFVGALFGHHLSQDNLLDIVNRVNFSVVEDNGWRDEFSWLSSRLDSMAAQHGATNFRTSSTSQWEEIVTKIMEKIPPRESRILALFSEQERKRRRMMKSTIPQLVRIYKFSGVPWRYRGYKSWPGVPGDMLEYTKPGPTYKCQ